MAKSLPRNITYSGSINTMCYLNILRFRILETSVKFGDIAHRRVNLKFSKT